MTGEQTEVARLELRVAEALDRVDALRAALARIADQESGVWGQRAHEALEADRRRYGSRR